MSQQRNCLMLLDNASSHGVADTLLTKVGSLDAFRLTNLLLLFLPPNCTSVVQPLDQGINAAFKAHYKGKLARYMVLQYTTLIPVRIYRHCRLRPILSRSVFFFFTCDIGFLFLSYKCSYIYLQYPLLLIHSGHYLACSCLAGTLCHNYILNCWCKSGVLPGTWISQMSRQSSNDGSGCWRKFPTKRDSCCNYKVAC